MSTEFSKIPMAQMPTFGSDPRAAVPNVSVIGSGASVKDGNGTATKVQPAEPVVEFDPKQVREQLEDSMAWLNEQMRANGRDLQFSIDQVVDRTVITVTSRESGSTVRQIPDESLLNVARSIEELKGVLFNSVS